jgi:hypothetical protein
MTNLVTPAELMARFSYMFDGPNIGISFVRGWHPMFVKLCEDIDAALGESKRKFRWLQVKEKFGSARFYYSVKGKSELRIDMISPTAIQSMRLVKKSPGKPDAADLAAMREKIRDLVDAAEAWTQDHCIVCGSAAALDRSQPYLMVLCSEHLRARKNNTLGSGSLWMQEDES